MAKPRGTQSKRAKSITQKESGEVLCSACSHVSDQISFLPCGHAVCSNCFSDPNIENQSDEVEQPKQKLKRKRVASSKETEQATCPICLETSLINVLKSTSSSNNNDSFSFPHSGPDCDRCGKQKAAVGCASCNFVYCSTCSEQVHTGQFGKHSLEIIEPFQLAASKIIMNLSKTKNINAVRIAMESFASTTGKSLVQMIQNKLYTLEGEGGVVSQMMKELDKELNEKMQSIVAAVQHRLNALQSEIKQSSHKYALQAETSATEIRQAAEGIQTILKQMNSTPEQENNNATPLDDKSDNEVLELKNKLVQLLTNLRNIPPDNRLSLYLEPSQIVDQISQLGSVFELNNAINVRLNPSGASPDARIASNLKSAFSKTDDYCFVRGLPSLSPGAQYTWKVRVDTKSDGYGPSVGVCTAAAKMTNSWRGDEKDWWLLECNELYGNGTCKYLKGKNLQDGDVVTVHLDYKNGEIVWAVNDENIVTSQKRLKLPKSFSEPLFPLFGLHESSAITIL